MQTMKECVLAAYRRELQDYVPCPEQVLKGAICLGDNYIQQAGEGYDAWGVRWHFGGGNPGLNGPTPVPGSELMDDFDEWREKVHFPDVGKLPWQITKSMVPEDRSDIVVYGLLLSGPFAVVIVVDNRIYRLFCPFFNHQVIQGDHVEDPSCEA